MRKIKKGDEVVILTGRDRGKRGKILRFSDNLQRVVVEGVHLIKKHVKPNPQKNQTGGIVEREAAMDISNIAIFNPTTQKADRVGFKTLDDGRHVRIFKSSGEVVDV